MNKLLTGAVALALMTVVGCGERRPVGADGSVPWKDTTYFWPEAGPLDLPWGRDWHSPPPPVDHGLPPLDHWVPPPPKDIGPPCIGTEGVVCGGANSCCKPLNCTQLNTGISICARSCTPDDPTTPLVNEDSCSNLSVNICGRASAIAGKHICLRRCYPALGKKGCPTGVACRPESTTYTGDPTKAVCVYASCKGAKDCPVRLSQDCNLTTPGTICTGAGIPSGAFCAPDRPGMVQGKCALGGSCDLVSGLCKPHLKGKATAKVGDPCKDDRDCPNQGFCDQQSGGGGLPHARNGYCSVIGCTFASTLFSFACPGGSTCQNLTPGGRCYKSCDLSKAADCRGYAKDKHGDYDCYRWDNLTMGSVPIANGPTCEPVDPYPCTLFGSNPSLNCSVLGNKTNSTKMACRQRTTGKELSKFDPGGFCLDLTASGP
jgi:hypothetical protein